MPSAIRLVHIHHNGFLAHLSGPGGNRSLLFDYPGDEHLPGEIRPLAEALLREETRGRDLAVFLSHSHADHCNPRLPDLVADAAETAWVLSDDVPDMMPELAGRILDRFGPASLLVAEPDEQYEHQGMAVSTLMSNDLGLAFDIGVAGLRVYFGGDLALWDWPGARPQDSEFTRRFYGEALERIAEQGPVDLAFSNTDPRLDNLSGGPEFVDRVRPALFAPMHVFGRTDTLLEVRERTAGSGSEVFLYQGCGDGAEYLLDGGRAVLVSETKGERP